MMMSTEREQPDPPEGPVWLSNAENSAWQSGWSSGWQAARSLDSGGRAQEPVAWIHPLDLGRECSTSPNRLSEEQIPLYAAPQITAEDRERARENIRSLSLATDMHITMDGKELDSAIDEAIDTWKEQRRHHED